MGTDTTGDILRATSWDEYVGQEKLKTRLSLHIRAANATNATLDHILLDGPPGVGKTTIAQIIADELGTELAVMKMPVKPKVLASFLREWEGGVLFLDEIHEAKTLQHDLLVLCEEHYLQLDNGRRIYAPDTTIIGATTEPHRLLKPLRDRFPHKPKFEDYSDEDMGLIIAGMAKKVGVKFTKEEREALGRATGGIPRHARTFVLTARDLTAVGEEPTVDRILDVTETTPDGLTADHVAYMTLMREMGGAEVGLTTLSTILRLPEPTVRDLERLLQKKGLIQFERTGRELTNTGWGAAKRRAS
jgi:Holliday junction DNA helicase RuvB